MHTDLHHRPTLVKNWLATLHGPELTVRPRLDEPLPSWGPLLRLALAWHVAYALVAYAGALLLSRSGSTSAVATAVREGGQLAVVVTALLVWWSGVALSTALWWAGVKRARQR
jgi:hypothetical protein